MTHEDRRKAALVQLEKAGYLTPLTLWTPDGEGVRFAMPEADRARLLLDGEQGHHFKRGPASQFHKRPGFEPVAFRSHTGIFGPGSLELEVDLWTGEAYADVDKFGAWTDAVGGVGHVVGELVPHGLKGLWRKIRRQKET